MFANTGPCDLLPTARQTMHGMSGEPVRESIDGDGVFKTGRRASRTACDAERRTIIESVQNTIVEIIVPHAPAWERRS
ncbi:hypothetical protein ALO62_103528 [Pseudomonas amygdali pv. myricae]|nr:hypothetical protein ALO62_103528 [Pseudomonas amygdali pv. myricae]RMT51832.1 hypothetical protein ALP46_102737 [Pseudomonas amygdali pv. myricae]RMU96295.1 hypothetical protein ALP18_102509 [Pseudomonas amygdali pv. myricae]RMV24528.1 hypothetical protein ALP14_102716 [Pseudomonas amygdali pv. myricae]